MDFIKEYFHLQKYPLFTVIFLALYLAVKNTFISKNSCFSITFIYAEWCLSSNGAIDYIWSIYKVLFNTREKRESDAWCSVQDSEVKDVTWNPYSIAFYSNFVFDFSEARISSIIYILISLISLESDISFISLTSLQSFIKVKC